MRPAPRGEQKRELGRKLRLYRPQLPSQIPFFVFLIEETKRIVQDLKKLGLTNAKQSFNYSFSFVKKYCKEKNLCNFKTIIKRKNNRRLTFYKIL